MISKYILWITFLNEPELISCTQLNGFTYFYQIRIILFTIIICLQTVKCFQVLLINTNNSINHQSFVYTQLNDQTVLFQGIQFSMSTKLNSSKYSYESLTIQLNISHLFTRLRQLSHESFVYIVACKSSSISNNYAI